MKLFTRIYAIALLGLLGLLAALLLLTQQVQQMRQVVLFAMNLQKNVQILLRFSMILHQGLLFLQKDLRHSFFYYFVEV